MSLHVFDTTSNSWKQVAGESNFMGGGSVPLGTIALWSGGSNTIPTGWYECDGTTQNGFQTPNLSISNALYIMKTDFSGVEIDINVSNNGVNGNLNPAVDNTYDLGQSNLRWRNIYTTDLQLSNEGSSNEVDGTWGKWTIQEGEDDLYLINRRNGKKYKFNLELVE